MTSNSDHDEGVTSDEFGGEQSQNTDKNSKSVKQGVDERLPDEPLSMAETDSSVAGMAGEFADAASSIIATLIIAVAKLVPFSERFFRGLINSGYRGLLAKSGCDYIGHIMVGDEVKHVPVNYDHEHNRFKNRHGDWWKAPTEGEYTYRVADKVPTVWASAASNHVGSHLQAEIAEALELGNSRDLYKNANVTEVTVQGETPSPQAIADGGAAQTQQRVSVDRPGQFVDELVELSTEADARVVSLDKYYETYPVVVDTEEMQRQEDRGRMAENERDMASLALKFMLVAAGIVGIVVLGPPAINALFGGGVGGGGGGGSIIPGMLAGGFL